MQNSDNVDVVIMSIFINFQEEYTTTLVNYYKASEKILTTHYNLYTIITKKIGQLRNTQIFIFLTSDLSFLFDLSKVAIMKASPLVLSTSSTQQINPFCGS